MVGGVVACMGHTLTECNDYADQLPHLQYGE